MSEQAHDSFDIKVECKDCDWTWEGWNAIEADDALRYHQLLTTPDDPK